MGHCARHVITCPPWLDQHAHSRTTGAEGYVLAMSYGTNALRVART